MIEFERNARSGHGEGSAAESIDPTLQSLTRGLAETLELQSRYRVYQFEAMQDGQARTAETFKELRQTHGRQIAALRAGLGRRLELLATDEGRAT